MPISLQRKTKETDIRLEFDAAGGAYTVKTPIDFLTHMIEAFAKHGRFQLKLTCESKDKDPHHATEDVAIVLGQAVRKTIEAGPVKRFGHEAVPMDDALVACYIDAGGRAYYEGRLPDPLYEHFLRSFANEAGINLHVDVMRGRETHHIVEAAFKALGRSLRRALEPADGVASTKGKVEARGR
jgi:imidazoleglycerol-phosphate dehydratase